MEPMHFFWISALALIGAIYLTWRRRSTGQSSWFGLVGRIIATIVFGVLGLIFGVWVALLLSGPSEQEFSGVVFLVYALFSVPIGVVAGTIFGMALFKIIAKLFSQKKYEKK